ncbi:Type I inositol polyphosphate 5-phosphatase 8 [Linum perenne]
MHHQEKQNRYPHSSSSSSFTHSFRRIPHFNPPNDFSPFGPLEAFLSVSQTQSDNFNFSNVVEESDIHQKKHLSLSPRTPTSHDCCCYFVWFFYFLSDELERLSKRSSDRVRRSKIDIDAAHHVTDTEVNNYRVFVATWNVAGKSPPSNLSLEDWLHTSPPADVYVLGFQEIVPLNAGNVLGTEDNGPARKWLALIRKTLNALPGMEERDKGNYGQQSSYCLVASKQMVGIFLTVWVRSSLKDDVKNMKVSCVGRGLMGYLGNKKEGDELRRNSDVMEILRKTRFPRVHDGDENSPQTILEHDRVIWLGDLNYRIALSYRSVKTLVEMRNWRLLLENDQACLRMEKRLGRVFEGWHEGRIYFPPTYKYSNNSDRYAGDDRHPKEKRRTPAWLVFFSLLVCS